MCSLLIEKKILSYKFQRMFKYVKRKSHFRTNIGTSRNSSKNYLQCIFILIIFICVCIYLNSTDNLKDVEKEKKTIPIELIQLQTIETRTIRTQINQTRANAFIISIDCNSPRSNFTKENIHRIFPKFFTIYCFKPIPLTDPRIDKSLSFRNKKLASSLLSFVTVWTDEIPKYSTNDEHEWSFVFEDDVGFVEPSNVSLPNYVNALQELMHYPDVQLKHGMFYLGICGPKFPNDSHALIASFSNNSLLSRRGCGMCTHAVGLTTERARSLWGEISSYLPHPRGAVDSYIRNYCVRSGNPYYILGANLLYEPNINHYGIAYQDRERFHSEIW